MACSDGSVPHKCLVDPCLTGRCPAVEGAVCVADYCGGCRDRWMLGDMEVTKKCQQGLASVSAWKGLLTLVFHCLQVLDFCIVGPLSYRLDAAASFQQSAGPS